MNLWRIATETRKYSADDLSGGGAAMNPGRWNDYNEPVVYCALTRALAALETVAHIDDGGLPLNRYVVEILVPPDTWDSREEADITKLPAAWDAIPAGRASVQYGSRWLSVGASPILLVPSVIVPEERCALINPKHPASSEITARIVRRFEYDRVLRTK